MAVFAIVFSGWIVSVCLHEFGHALTAYVGGDEGIRRRGYLTNPFTYIQPWNSIILPVLCIAIAGLALPGAAVMVDERRIRWRLMRVLMYLAGPLMTGLCGIGLAAPFYLGVWSVNDPRPLVVACGMLVQLEAMAFVLNLMPVPPLDGFQACASLLLSFETKHRLMRAATWAPVALTMVMMASRDAQAIVWGIAFRITGPLGLTPATFERALAQLQFWR